MQTSRPSTWRVTTEYVSTATPCPGNLSGLYFGYQSWDVTNYITGGDSTMTFDRNSTDSGDYSGYFKIPLALLTVEEEE